MRSVSDISSIESSPASSTREDEKLASLGEILYGDDDLIKEKFKVNGKFREISLSTTYILSK